MPILTIIIIILMIITLWVLCLRFLVFSPLSPLTIESNPVRFALCGRGPHGVLRLYAAATQLQAAVAGLCGRPPEKLHHTDIPAATASLFR